jgi:hypothetical protein
MTALPTHDNKVQQRASYRKGVDPTPSTTGTTTNTGSTGSA